MGPAQVHEELQALRGNIRVVCRARPLQAAGESALAFPAPGAVTVSPPDRLPADFEFNACFGAGSSQVDTTSRHALAVRTCLLPRVSPVTGLGHISTRCTRWATGGGVPRDCPAGPLLPGRLQHLHLRLRPDRLGCSDGCAFPNYMLCPPASMHRAQSLGMRGGGHRL